MPRCVNRCISGSAHCKGCRNLNHICRTKPFWYVTDNCGL
nr:MAG TPA: hypothetical protein [Caudoviricetes sp.]DAV25436.1 MAG TPA: hypothetical protein [Caudoviricetes sp.]